MCSVGLELCIHTCMYLYLFHCVLAQRREACSGLSHLGLWQPVMCSARTEEIRTGVYDEASVVALCWSLYEADTW